MRQLPDDNAEASARPVVRSWREGARALELTRSGVRQHARCLTLGADRFVERIVSHQRAGRACLEGEMNDNCTLDQVLYARDTSFRLPKGWRWGVYFCVRGGALQGHYAVRESDGFSVMIAYSPEPDAPSPAAAIKRAIADGLISRVKHRSQAKRLVGGSSKRAHTARRVPSSGGGGAGHDK